MMPAPSAVPVCLFCQRQGLHAAFARLGCRCSCPPSLCMNAAPGCTAHVGWPPLLLACLHRIPLPWGPSFGAGEDALPPELQGQLDWEVLTAPFFIEAAVVLPQHGALLLADTGAPSSGGCALWRPPAALWLAHRGLGAGGGPAPGLLAASCLPCISAPSGTSEGAGCAILGSDI